MKGDFTRFTFDPNKRYSGVRMQQGRVQLDADWNEQLDIQRHRDRVTRCDTIGASGVPTQVPGSLALSLYEGAPRIAAGRCYAGGLLCENQVELALADQPGFVAPDEPGVYVAYLDVWEREISPIEDPNLLEVALTGADTAMRTKIEWQARVERVGGLDDDLNGQLFTADWRPSQPASTGRLRARLDSGKVRNLDNQLFRVEVHASGIAEPQDEDPRPVATFKWSQNNGATAAQVRGIGFDANKTLITVNVARGDDAAEFVADAWIEVVNERRILADLPGVVVQIASARGDELEVDGPLPGWIEADERSPTIVRRWDGLGAGQLRADQWQDLACGVQVEFSPSDGAGGDAWYRAGDHWLIPARALLGGIVWPIDDEGEPLLRRSSGGAHRSCPIALVEVRLEEGEMVWSVRRDLRPRFFPATQSIDEQLAQSLRRRHYHGITDVDSNMPLTLHLHFEGERHIPRTVKLFLRGSRFSRAFYTELGQHIHGAKIDKKELRLSHSHSLGVTNNTHAHNGSSGGVGLSHGHGHGLSINGGSHSHAIRVGDTGAANKPTDHGWSGSYASGHGLGGWQYGGGWVSLLPVGLPAVAAAKGEYTVSATGHAHGISGGIHAALGTHSHTVSVAKSTHGHGVSGAINQHDADHDHGVTIHASGSGAVQAESTVKEFIADLTFKVNGEDQTSLLLDKLGWDQLGDGTQVHSLSSTGTGILDITDMIDLSVGSHELCFEVASGGGKILYDVFCE